MMGRRTRSGVPWRSALAMLWVFFAMAALLSGCAPIDRQQSRVKAWWAALTGTASGALSTVRETVSGTVEAGKDTVEVGKKALSGAQATVKDVTDRAAKVKEGVSKIREGKHLIEEGVGR